MPWKFAESSQKFHLKQNFLEKTPEPGKSSKFICVTFTQITVGKGLEEITRTFSLKNFQRALWDCLLKYSAQPVQKNNICHECSTYLKIESWTIFQYHYQYSSIIIIIIVVITKMTVITISSVLFCFFFWHIHVTLLYTLQIFHITSLPMESSTKLYQQW